MAYGVSRYEYPDRGFGEFINGSNMTVTSVFIGLGGNIVFGFIDNAGLFFGGCYLDEVFSLLPAASDANVCAGYGNTFSDFLGAFLGTFVGKMLADTSKIEESPLWSEAIGIIIGCLLGVAIPKMIMGNSETKGLNKVAANSIILGNMDEEELKAIIEDNQTVGKYRADKVFKKLDADSSGYIDKDEIRNYLMKAMGDDWNEDQFQEDMNTSFNIDFDGRSQDFNKEEWRAIYKKMAESMLAEKTGVRNSRKSQELKEITQENKGKDIE